MLHPITFSIPREKVVDDVPKKTKLLSNLIPGNTTTYIYENERDYYNEYQASLFAMTTKKGGWDCMRHYEIIANGAIPYFPGMEQCPEKTMALFPKQIVIKGNALYARLKNKIIDEEDMREYTAISRELLSYLRENLTTRKMAEYVLQKVGRSETKRILYLSGNVSPDYLRCVTLHGFKDLMGANCHDYPKVPHLYKTDHIDYVGLYGRGITYTNLLDSMVRDDSLDNSIEDDIINRRYDLIIYGSYHRGMPFYDLVMRTYAPSEIVLLCGEDEHVCDCNNHVNKGHNVFVRELT
jgi:hypothetical protein